MGNKAVKIYSNEYDIKPGFCIRTIMYSDGTKEVSEIDMDDEMKKMTNRTHE